MQHAQNTKKLVINIVPRIPKKRPKSDALKNPSNGNKIIREYIEIFVFFCSQNKAKTWSNVNPRIEAKLISAKLELTCKASIPAEQVKRELDRDALCNSILSKLKFITCKAGIPSG